MTQIPTVLNFIQNNLALYLIFQSSLQEGISSHLGLNPPFASTLRSPVVSLSKNDVSLWIFNLVVSY